ncbi:MAG: hypothetical protein WC294_10270 [Methanoregula sp.]|jgi:hypothetical protein
MEEFEVRYKKIMVESIKVRAESPEEAMYIIEKGDFSSVGAKIWNRYPMIEAILAENGNGKITKKV